MVVYVKTQGARIVKEGRHLLVKKGDATYYTLFTYKLKQLLLFGNIEITHSALIQLMRKNIDTVFLTRYGRYLGRLASPESKNVFLHKRQYHLLDDSIFGLRVVQAIIAGKISNMATLLMRIKRSRNRQEAGHKARQIQNLMPQLDMNMIVAYDIADPKRLNKVAKVIKDYGIRVQKSIFEVAVSNNLFLEMKSRIEDIIEPTADGVKYFSLCEKCAGTVEIIGQGIFIDPDEEFYVL